MQFQKQRNARILLAQYIFNNSFVPTDIENLKSFFKREEMDEIKLNFMYAKYEDNKDRIQSLLDSYNINDLSSYAIIVVAMVEKITGARENLCISESLKFADFYCYSQASFIHCILKQVLSKI